MHGTMTGVRVLEVAGFTFVPSAGAVLADWGAGAVNPKIIYARGTAHGSTAPSANGVVATPPTSVRARSVAWEEGGPWWASIAPVAGAR